jgi:hypothetical protein
MLKGISRRQFAKLDGCSEKLVRRALLQGKLIAFDDGTISEELVGTLWRKRADKGAAKGAESADTRRAPTATFAESQCVKEFYLGKLRQLEFEVKSGRLIAADAVESEFLP